MASTCIGEFGFHGRRLVLYLYIYISLFSSMQAKNHLPLNDGQIEEAARLFATLSEPSRLRLLQLLMRGPMTVTELVEATGMKQGNVSKQLGTLYDVRLVKRNREGNFIRYAIGDEMIFQLCNLACQQDSERCSGSRCFVTGSFPDGKKREFVKVARLCGKSLRKPVSGRESRWRGSALACL